MIFALYKWIDRRNSIPFWVRWIFPNVHWCPEMDEMLIMGDYGDCYCGAQPPPNWRGE